MTLEETMQKIRPVDAAAMAAAKQHWDGLGKPLGSLGRLEKALIQIAGIQRTGDVHIDRKALVIMCADNGVVEEGVTQCGPEQRSVRWISAWQWIPHGWKNEKSLMERKIWRKSLP